MSDSSLVLYKGSEILGEFFIVKNEGWILVNGDKRFFSTMMDWKNEAEELISKNNIQEG